MPCRSGSPQGVVSVGAGAALEAAGACAEVHVLDTEMTTPTATPASVIIEPENLSRMMLSFLLCSALL
jgi:hypothetical protein